MNNQNAEYYVHYHLSDGCTPNPRQVFCDPDCAAEWLMDRNIDPFDMPLTTCYDHKICDWNSCSTTWRNHTPPDPHIPGT